MECVQLNAFMQKISAIKRLGSMLDFVCISNCRAHDLSLPLMIFNYFFASVRHTLTPRWTLVPEHTAENHRITNFIEAWTIGHRHCCRPQFACRASLCPLCVDTKREGENEVVYLMFAICQWKMYVWPEECIAVHCQYFDYRDGQRKVCRHWATTINDQAERELDDNNKHRSNRDRTNQISLAIS